MFYLTCLWFKLFQINLFGSHQSFETKWQNSAIYSKKQTYKKFKLHQIANQGEDKNW